MAKQPDKIYEFHVANLRAIDVAISRVTRPFRHAISTVDDKTIFVFVRLYTLLTGIWAETRLMKLLFEKVGFSKGEREEILSEHTQIDMWFGCVEKAFRLHYNVPRAPLSEENLNHSQLAKYLAISNMIDEDLRSIIELRNKLAHGQWHYPLNNEGNDVSQDNMDTLRRENLLSLQFKKALLGHLCNLIHDLIVSKPTFERDFDVHYRMIVETRRNLRNRSYEDYVRLMGKKYTKGQQMAAGNI